MAKAIRTKPRCVEAIERDEFHKLIAPVYAKGFIKLYAVCVELDPAPLTRQFAQMEFITEVTSPPAGKIPRREPAPKKEAARKRMTLLIAGLVDSIRKLKLPGLSLPEIPRLKQFNVPAKAWITLIAVAAALVMTIPLLSRIISAQENKIRLSPECRWLADPPEPYLDVPAMRVK